jgi:DNA-binding IclR family transcriptional regulator
MSDNSDSPIGRAFRILEILAAAPEGLSLTEIADASGLVVTTVHRQVGSLVSLGLVRRSNARSFMLGERMWRLATAMTGGTDVAAAAEPILKELVDHFGETAFLARLVGDQVELMITAHPDAQGQAYAQPGRGMPLHAAASGKILLALQTEDFITDYLKLPRQSFTANTKVKEADIRADIARARQRHIAVCENEFDPGILSYASPVHDQRTGLSYALAVFGLAERFSKTSVASVETHLINASNRLSLALRGAKV